MALIAAGVWYYSGTATVYLENHSTGRSLFYVDDNRACDAQPDALCTVRLYVWKTHTLRAYTYYGDKSPYQSPQVRFQVQRNEVYRYVSCGMTGSPQQNCGIFSIRMRLRRTSTPISPSPVGCCPGLARGASLSSESF